MWKDLEAYATALRGLLRGEDVEWNGTLHTLLHRDGVVARRPVDVPLLLAAEGPKGLEIAARVADGVISFGQPKAGFPRERPLRGHRPRLAGTDLTPRQPTGTGI